MTRKQPDSIPLVDVLKALASQLIVWHHLAVYGPMSETVHPHASSLIDALYDHARLAVQVFLVVGGFLTARSLLARPGAPARALAPADGLALVWRRYVRLSRPYLVALFVAIAAAWLARQLVEHPSNPQAPELLQLLANAVMLQDVLDAEALSAGVWYVAIDLQLYALTVALCIAAGAMARLGLPQSTLFKAGSIVLAIASLFWINLDPALDAWGLYFFGAYGMGLAAQWISVQRDKARWMLLLAALLVAALAWEWRSRILVAGLTALLLAGCPGALLARRWAESSTVAWLARISYAVFLVHYPVLVATGAVMHRFWPGMPMVHAAGMLLAWLLSLACGTLLHRWVEAPAPRPAPVPSPSSAISSI